MENIYGIFYFWNLTVALCGREIRIPPNKKFSLTDEMRMFVSEQMH